MKGRGLPRYEEESGQKCREEEGRGEYETYGENWKRAKKYGGFRLV